MDHRELRHYQDRMLRLARRPEPGPDLLEHYGHLLAEARESMVKDCRLEPAEEAG